MTGPATIFEKTKRRVRTVEPKRNQRPSAEQRAILVLDQSTRRPTSLLVKYTLHKVRYEDDSYL